MTPGEALRGVCDAWERGDPAAAAALFAADGTYEDPLYPEPLRGRDAIRAGLAEGMALIEECRVTLDPVMEDGPRAVAVGGFASRMRESGSRFDFPFAVLVEMAEPDGGIRRLAEFFDTRPLAP
jgi:ketosteroid isomerase-like protein